MGYWRREAGNFSRGAVLYRRWSPAGTECVKRWVLRQPLYAENRVGNAMKKALFALAVAALSAWAGEGPGGDPFQSAGGAVPGNRIDDLVVAELTARGIEPALPSSDAVFVRRVYLDVIGTLPQVNEVREFLEDTNPDKRAVLIDRLLEREEFADYWALKWCDVLRVKAEFPINLWPNAVQAYAKWLHDAIQANMPYDAFARALLTSSGSNFRVPPVNFYRAMQGRDPSTIADAAALTFMGVRLDGWPEARRAELAVFFSRVAYKPTAEWKEEIVLLDPSAVTPLDAVFPDGQPVHIEAGEDPRAVFADWLTAPENPYFARNVVNRVWAWLMGRGIVHEPDDIRPDNPPVNPALLAYLEDELVRADYDLRQVCRLILNSRTYQQSSIPRSEHAEAETLFGHYLVRQLDAEVLIDALCGVLGSRESYLSMVPEPFTYVPDHQRTILLADGSITSPFLEMFGRPSRDTGLASERNLQPTDGQRLHMLNSTHIQQKIERSWRLRQLVETGKGDTERMARLLYLHILSRYPTAEETGVVKQYFERGDVTRAEAAADLAWALINSKEFLYRH